VQECQSRRRRLDEIERFFLKVEASSICDIYILKCNSKRSVESCTWRFWGHSRQIGWGFVEKGWERVSKEEILRRRWLSCGREAQLPP
jgi:hypothetical protein